MPSHSKFEHTESERASKRQKTSHDEHKVRTLQRAWREVFQGKTTFRLANQCLTMTVARVPSTSFEALVALLRKREVVNATKSCLQRVHLLSTFLHGPQSTPTLVNVRVFLAAYLVVHYPKSTFVSMGPLEETLATAARSLLASFENICSDLVASDGKCFSCLPASRTQDFARLLFEYLQAFKAWKIPDEARLTTDIRRALKALYTAYDPSVDVGLRVQVKEAAEKLREKLVRIAGEAALQAFDEEHNVAESSLVLDSVARA